MRFLPLLVGFAYVAVAILQPTNLRLLLTIALIVLPFTPAYVGFRPFPDAPMINESKMIFAIVLVAWFLRTTTRKLGGIPRGRWTALVAALTAVQLVSVGVSADPLGSFYMWAGYACYYYFWYFCVLATLETEADIRRTAVVMAAVGSVCAGFAAYEAATGYNWWQQQDWFEVQAGPEMNDIVRYGTARAAGAFGNYLTLGMFLGLVWPLWLILDTPDASTRKRFLVRLLAILGCAAVWAPVSRGAIVGVGVAALMGFLVFARSRTRIRTTAGILGGAVFASLLLYQTVSTARGAVETFLRDSFDPSYGASVNFRSRVDIAADDLQAMLARPLLGYGVGMASKLTDPELPRAVRSFYPTLWLESGVVAPTAFIALLVGSLWLAIVRGRKALWPWSRQVYLASGMAIVAIGTALASINMPEPFYYLFAILAMLHRTARLEDLARAQAELVPEPQPAAQRRLLVIPQVSNSNS